MNKQLRLFLTGLSAVLLFVSLYCLRALQVEQRERETLRQTLGVKVQTENHGVPQNLLIPSINVNASVERVGVATSGEMEVPQDTLNAGWFDPGPRPGQKGSAVIAGHFNGTNGDKGVFSDLSKLQAGDKIYVKDDKGIITTFVVRETGMYNPGYAEEVFGRSDGRHLNLITCDGVWEETTKSYSKRLVVFTDLID